MLTYCSEKGKGSLIINILMKSPLWTNLHVLIWNKYILGHTCTTELIEVLINHRIEMPKNENHGVHSKNKNIWSYIRKNIDLHTIKS